VVDLEKDYRLYKIDVTVEDDFCCVDNVKKVLCNETQSPTFYNIQDWEKYYCKQYMDYLHIKKTNPDEYIIFMESFYFHNEACHNDQSLKKHISKYVKQNFHMKLQPKSECKFNFAG
jgi:hypothetical protein